ncbi:hypothetical protein [Sphingopyxis granuli]|uniref:hypothetical protein n=1 Tax=Sphingopyxis granuli TaxID=267128 RepID=UPI001BAE768A|nr:hypothetical protein [Sphingopyxis granuli]QUM71428.1 hypothetical protein ICN83_13880 [Sphingopyxis granuli]
MTPSPLLFALSALIPAMTGPLPGTSQRMLAVMLCGGGATSVPLGGQAPAGDTPAPCCAKGCHNSRSRKQIDRAQ